MPCNWFPFFRSNEMKRPHQHHEYDDHGLSDNRRMVVAMEKIARSLNILVDHRITTLTKRLNKSSDALERAVKKATPKN